MPPQVPRLFELCKKVLKANVVNLVDVGDVPYEMIREVLFGCRVDQLREIEALSPHIADRDEEIWEVFFKRDFPIVYETRLIGSSTSPAQYSSSSYVLGASSLSAGGPSTSSAQTANTELSFRDLYNDEQVAREERLATAGTRLKERIASLKQQKEERRVVLDPRLGLDKRRYKPGMRRGMGMSTHWARGGEYKPKSLADKARVAAGRVALAYRPPTIKAARGCSVRVAVSRSLTGKEPNYKDALEDEEHVQGSAKTGKGKQTKFVERVVPVRVKSSQDKPYKASSPTKQDLAVPTRSTTVTRLPNITSAQRSASTALPVPHTTPIKPIPGITRRPKPVKPPDPESPMSPSYTTLPTATFESPSLHGPPPAIQQVPTISPPPHADRDPQPRPQPASLPLPPTLPMLAKPPPTSFPPAARSSMPSIFIPRKRPKLS